MSLVVPAVISGIAIGLLYAMLGFGIVFIYKATGVANFAQGTIGTFLVMAVYMLGAHGPHLPFAASLVVGSAISILFGLTVYTVAMRPHDQAGPWNLMSRTLAIYLGLGSLIDLLWGANQPFEFRSLFPTRSVRVFSTYVSEQSFGTLGVFVVLAVALWVFFKYTRMGLMMRGTAENPGIAKLLGINTRLLAAVAWSVGALLAFIVGVLAAPTALLTTGMLDPFLLYAFTGIIIGGLQSFPGCVVGGLLVGVVGNVSAALWGSETSILMIFGLLVLTLAFRPVGIFGRHVAERL